ncbi:hypothetical protein L6164_016806 [Bauhinia variegata]|uniref:Uncharacterized protein n=1 Tax=Bauhinia variegata TaxID=167791 RepID=A0ACB9N5W8_BAUVA|nr:hypothetical protein L6164_016806 [Bauhinia variegata]
MVKLFEVTEAKLLISNATLLTCLSSDALSHLENLQVVQAASFEKLYSSKENFILGQNVIRSFVMVLYIYIYIHSSVSESYIFDIAIVLVFVSDVVLESVLHRLTSDEK